MIPLNKVPRVVKFTETESGIVVAGARGERRMGSYCLMGTRFQLEKIKKFWR